MGAYDAMFGGETATSSRDENLIAPKKSSMSGRNPELQPSTEEDDLDAIMRGSVERNKGKVKNEPSIATSALQNLFAAKKKAKDLAFEAVAPIVEPLAAMTTGAQAAVIGPATGIVANLRSGKYGTQEGIDIGKQQAQNYAQQTTYQPKTESGKAITEAIAKIPEKITGSHMGFGPLPETYGFAPLGQAAAEQGLARTGQAANQIQASYQKLREEMPTVRVERTGEPNAMQSGGAAVASNKAMLDEAIGRATPELAAQLKTLKPEQVNKVALENQIVADTLPVPVRLTEGQALQDPRLISFERNDRGMKEKLSQHFNEQNKALQENANLIKQKTSEGTFETDYVANAERAMEAYKEINTARQAEIKSAYDALDQLGAGKIEVDSKSFGQNAIKALTENEDIDFLPSVIKTKIEAYQGGKPMNFAQYENLRTQIARETRKAQRADDGNAVHALTLARSELEKLPLLNETAEAKVVADKARSLAKSEFDLLDKRKDTYNSVYADVVNGGADTKDFIPKVVLRSKNTDFAKAMDLLKDNPDAIKQLRAGTLDYIIRESTDASGNFKTGKFTDIVNNLDVNKKLTALFGEDAQQIKDLAKTGQLIESRPRGSFVNESNTSVANMASQYAKGAAEQGINVAAKGLPIGTMGRQFLEKRAAAKQVEKTLKPGAGVSLKDIGKEK